MINWKSFLDESPKEDDQYLLARPTVDFSGRYSYSAKLYRYDKSCCMFYDINNLDYGYFKPKDDWFWCQINNPKGEEI